MTTILEIEKLNVSYHGTSILQDINMKVEKGEILGIVGESGSGKSTLLKAIIGLLGDNGRVESGRVSFDQVDLLRISQKELRNIRGTQLGMVFQNPGMSFNPIRKIGSQFLEALKNHRKIDEAQTMTQSLEMFAKLGLGDGKRILNSYQGFCSITRNITQRCYNPYKYLLFMRVRAPLLPFFCALLLAGKMGVLHVNTRGLLISGD